MLLLAEVPDGSDHGFFILVNGKNLTSFTFLLGIKLGLLVCLEDVDFEEPAENKTDLVLAARGI